MWKTISEFNYEINIHGEIRNKKTLSLVKPNLNKYGYLKIGLRKAGDRKKYWFTIHRLVAYAFIDNINNYSEVDHIDRNKLNNTINNLRWVDTCTNNLNRKQTCWKTNTTTGELYISKYRNGYMIRINRNDYKFRGWVKNIEEAIRIRDNCMMEITSRSV